MTLTFCYSLAIIDVIAHMTIIANESIIVKIAVFYYSLLVLNTEADVQ